MTVMAQPITSADKAWEDKMARLAARKPLERTVTFVDEDLDLAADAAQVALGEAKINARAQLDLKHKDLKNAAERRARVEKEMPRDKAVREKQKVYDDACTARDEAEVKLVMRALAPTLYELLQAEHPPTDEQRKKGQTYNIDTFGPVLVAACCVDPMTPAQAASLIGGSAPVEEDGKTVLTKFEGTLGFGEASLLFSAAVGVNEGSRSLLGKG